MSPDAAVNWPLDITSESFLDEYWQKKPLLIRNAFPQFDNPLTPDELGGLALDDDIHSRLILREANSQWHLQTGPFSEEELTSLPTTDWSLLVSDVEKHLDGFYQYLQPFRFIPDWQIDDLMISYAPTGASVGAHIDEYDVFLLQAGGKREWSIDTRSPVDKTIIPDLSIRILQNFKATEQWTLDVGDMLYLPPGVPHHGVSLDNDCMTWSIGFRAIAHADLLRDIAHQVAAMIPDSARYRDTIAKLQCHPGEISKGTLRELYALWQQLTHIDQHAFNLFVGNVLTQRNADIPDEAWPIEKLPKEKAAHNLFDFATVERDSASRFAFTCNGDKTTLHADGLAYAVTRELAGFLCNDYRYDSAQLNLFVQSSNDRTCLMALLQRKILQDSVAE